MTTKALLLLLFSVTMSAFGQTAGALDRFSTMEACVAAVNSGNFQYYQPSYLSAHREPVAGEEIRGLEERACVDLHIVGGRGFVPQAKGTQYIFRGGQIVARYDCGNDAREIQYVPEVVVSETPPPPPAQLEFKFPPHQSTELVELDASTATAKELGPALSYEVVLEYLEKKGHKFPIPCFPREKGWYGTGLPILECAAIGAGLWYFWPVAEAVLIKPPTIVHSIALVP